MSTEPHSSLIVPHSSDDWATRMAIVVDTMREMSEHTDPQSMVRAYQQRMARIFPADRRVSLSRRALSAPQYRITRSSLWSDVIDPWKQVHQLPVLDGGLFSDLLYANEPRIIDDLNIAADDPAREHLAGQRSLMAIPLFDGGESLNMVIMTRATPAAFDLEVFPELVWMSNLFGKATHSLVTTRQLEDTVAALDRELHAVADIQRFLLPARLPRIATLDLAVHYSTSQRAGGDYYDFFPIDDHRWGILIADVSGHGTPAAVFMAITHAIAHTNPEPLQCPADFLRFMNEQLSRRYALKGIFVTAFYAVYDARSRTVSYASAGHNPPRVKHCSAGRLSTLDGAQALPLGITPDVEYRAADATLAAGDLIVFYTDGITETRNREDQQFGLTRLDDVLQHCGLNADGMIHEVLQAVRTFEDGLPAEDDRTLLVGKVT